jgi:co-chaperonin GroES (HSP10)
MMKKLTELKWLSDRILVLPDPPKETFQGTRIIVPDVVKAGEKADGGTILAMGPGRTVYETGVLIPVNKALEPGVRILFGRHAGLERVVDNVTYKILVEADILAVE